jgi:hypothetical protein
VPGASQAGAWRTKHGYEPKSPLRRADDRSDAKIVIVRGALYKNKRIFIKAGGHVRYRPYDKGGA